MAGKVRMAGVNSTLEREIREYVAHSPDNQLSTFGSEPVFDEPLVGFADGDASIFQGYKTIIGDFHLTPREILRRHAQISGGAAYQEPAAVGVIVWILPFTHENRLSVRGETSVPSLRWNYALWQGKRLMRSLEGHVVSVVRELGYRAVVPESADFWEDRELPNGRTSNWSVRHAAYAAGLGTFSLNDGFITARGIAMRCGSAVTTMPVVPSPHAYKNHLANCLFYRGQSCMGCIKRCPAHAITKQGHDKRKCREWIHEGQRAMLRQLGREGYIPGFRGCGLCQTRVPCEDRIPASAKLSNPLSSCP